MIRVRMHLLFFVTMLWGEFFGYWQGLLQASSWVGNCNKVGQDIFIWAGVESCPSQGQMGEAQEKIYCKKKSGSHWKRTFKVVLVQLHRSNSCKHCKGIWFTRGKIWEYQQKIPIKVQKKLTITPNQSVKNFTIRWHVFSYSHHTNVCWWNACKGIPI